MKKVLLVVFMMCAGIAVFAQNGNRITGIIRELTGEVELKPAGASAFTPAKVGSEVEQNTIVSTGFKGMAVIEVGSSTITVKPLTRLSLSEIQENSGAENLNVNLQAGRVKVDVKPPEGTRTNFTVQSPSATASVRGTSFDFDIKNLKVIEGTVSFTGKSGMQVSVSGGFSSYVEKRDTAADPYDVKRKELEPLPPVGYVESGISADETFIGETTIDIQLEF